MPRSRSSRAWARLPDRSALRPSHDNAPAACPSYGEVANVDVFAASGWARTITASEINFTGGAVVD